MGWQHETEGVEGAHGLEVWLGRHPLARTLAVSGQLTDTRSDRISLVVLFRLFSPQSSSSERGGVPPHRSNQLKEYLGLFCV